MNILKKLLLFALSTVLLLGHISFSETVYGQTRQDLQTEQKLSAFQKESKKVIIKLTNSKITLSKGKSKTLKAYVKGTNKKVKWSSSDKSIATVNQKGKITAKKAGTVKIKAAVNGTSATCQVEVTQTLTKKQAETAVCNYVKRKETSNFYYFYEGKEGSYYTFWVTYKTTGTKGKYFVNYKNGKSYVSQIYLGVNEWKATDKKNYIFSAYKYLK